MPWFVVRLGSIATEANDVQNQSIVQRRSEQQLSPWFCISICPRIVLFEHVNLCREFTCRSRLFWRTERVSKYQVVVAEAIQDCTSRR